MTWDRFMEEAMEGMELNEAMVTKESKILQKGFDVIVKLDNKTGDKGYDKRLKKILNMLDDLIADIDEDEA